MKTTSYEISKKLAELGFDRAFDFAYKKNDEVNVWNEAFEIRCWDLNRLDYYPAYDLETILEALPNFISNENGGENCLVIDVSFGEIHYEGDDENDALFITTTKPGESLADTAAKLLIQLHEKGLVIFNQSTNNTNDNT